MKAAVPFIRASEIPFFFPSFFVSFFFVLFFSFLLSVSSIPAHLLLPPFALFIFM